MAVAWRGVFAALTTELHEDGSLDLDATRRHAELMIDAGCGGLVALGTIGENTCFSAGEKRRILEAVVEVADGRVPVLAGIAEFTTAFACAAAREAMAAGVDGLMVLPALAAEQDAREAAEHFAAVAAATPLPIMVYNNPVAYRTDLDPAALEPLAGIANIVAVKDSSHDSRRLTDMIVAFGERFLLFCGVDDLVFENVLSGAVGWVSGLVNAFPIEAVRLFDLASEGRVAEARPLLRWFMPLLHLDRGPKLVQAVKLVNELAGTGREWVRRPRLPLVGGERERVELLVRRALATLPGLSQLSA